MEETPAEEKTGIGNIWFLVAVVVLTLGCIIASKVDFKKLWAAIKNINWKQLPKNTWNGLKALPGKIWAWMKTVPGKCKLLFAAACVLVKKIGAAIKKLFAKRPKKEKTVAPVQEEAPAEEEIPAQEEASEAPAQEETVE